MIKDIYDITLDLVGKIRRASEIQISEEITAAMLFAEIQVNLEVLHAAKEIAKVQESSWLDAIMMMSTEALELALFQKNGEKIIGKYFKDCKIPKKDAQMEITGTAAAFFIYRKITALKNIGVILEKAPSLSKSYKPYVRMTNIEKQMLAINKQLGKNLQSYMNKRKP
jgi:hypothetical protein